MELREGYKLTEIGIIPEDWIASELGTYVLINSGESPSKYRFSSFGIPYFKVEQLNNDSKYANSTPYRVLSAKTVPAGSIIFPKRGASILLNKIRILSEASFMDTNLMSLTSVGDLDAEYLYYFLYYAGLEKVADTTSIPQINNKHINPYRVAIPPKTEQTAIANALSDADALIQSLQKLIKKKRQIKQATMQTLLNRYENGLLKAAWSVKKLGDVLKVGHGRSQHEVIDQDGEFPILASGGEIGRASKFLYDKPSVLIGRKGTIDVPRFMDKPFWTIDTLFYTEIFEPNNAKYLFYQFQMIDWYSYNEASGVPSLSARTIENIEVGMPSAKEQISIATILSDMDTEISALESQLTKYQQIKQGMMQNLLTGRIRLI
jgi:type I restriction enzyme, S subunit